MRRNLESPFIISYSKLLPLFLEIQSRMWTLEGYSNFSCKASLSNINIMMAGATTVDSSMRWPSIETKTCVF